MTGGDYRIVVLDEINTLLHFKIIASGAGAASPGRQAARRWN